MEEETAEAKRSEGSQQTAAHQVKENGSEGQKSATSAVPEKDSRPQSPNSSQATHDQIAELLHLGFQQLETSTGQTDKSQKAHSEEKDAAAAPNLETQDRKAGPEGSEVQSEQRVTLICQQVPGAKEQQDPTAIPTATEAAIDENHPNVENKPIPSAAGLSESEVSFSAS